MCGGGTENLIDTSTKRRWFEPPVMIEEQCSPRSSINSRTPCYSVFHLLFLHHQHRTDYNSFKESSQLISSPLRCLFLIILSAYYLIEFVFLLTSASTSSSSFSSISSHQLYITLILLYSCCLLSLLIGWFLHFIKFIPRQISRFFSKKILASLLRSSSTSYASPRPVSYASPHIASSSASYWLSNLFLLTLSYNSFLVLIFRVLLSQRYLKDLYRAATDASSFSASDNDFDSIAQNSLPFNSLLPSDFILYLFLLPLLIQSFFKSCSFGSILITWCGSVCTATFCLVIIVPNGPQQLNFLHIYLFLLMNVCLLYNNEFSLLQQYLLTDHFHHFAADTSASASATGGLGEERRERNSTLMLHLEKQHIEKVIGSIAHDLRTPMQSLQLDMNSLIEMMLSPLSGSLLSSAPPSSVSVSGAAIGASVSSNCLTSPSSMAITYKLSDVQEMVTIIEDLHDTLHFMFASVNRGVDYCKIDSGTSLIQQRELVDYHLCVNNAIALVSRSVTASGIKIHHHHQSNLTDSTRNNKFVNTDKTWLFESLVCLISNAVKYSSGGDVSVYVERHDHSNHGNGYGDRNGNGNHGSGNGNHGNGNHGNGNHGNGNGNHCKSPSHQTIHHSSSNNSNNDLSTPYVSFTVENNSTESILTTLNLSDPSLIFQDFSVTNRTSGGAGLGLYILATRIKNLGGDYGCETKMKYKDLKSNSESPSAAGEVAGEVAGEAAFVTRFWFTLPLHSFSSTSGKSPKNDNDPSLLILQSSSQEIGSEQSLQKKFDIFENQRLQNFLISSRLTQQSHTSRRGSDEDSNNSLLSIRTLDFSRIDHVSNFGGGAGGGGGGAGGGSETSARRYSVVSAPVTVYEEEVLDGEDDHSLCEVEEADGNENETAERKQKQSQVSSSPHQRHSSYNSNGRGQEEVTEVTEQLMLVDIEQQTSSEAKEASSASSTSSSTLQNPTAASSPSQLQFHLEGRRKSDSKGYKPRFWKLNRKVHSASDLNATSVDSPRPYNDAEESSQEKVSSGNESPTATATTAESKSRILRATSSLGSGPPSPLRRGSSSMEVKEDQPMSLLRVSGEGMRGGDISTASGNGNSSNGNGNWNSNGNGNCPSPSLSCSSRGRILSPNTTTTLIPHQLSTISREEETPSASACTSSRLPRTILVVDDSTVIQKATKRSLVRAGFDVEVADNGLNGLILMKAKVFAAVLMDIEMPVMGGLEATQKIREFEAELEESSWKFPTAPCRPRQKIIGVTASTDSSTREKAMAVGMDEFVHKPFQLESIQMVFSRLSV